MPGPTAPTIIRVRVKANARQTSLEQLADGSFLARVKSPAIEGRANSELLALVAGHFGRPKAAVTVKSGAASRTKLIRIDPG
ncbi:MAG TPA: DUF167 domain-containing protein [Steroidobacteraceae bacterium]|nr:DUF167 domain-containing protein [Steroidobacteraceae bacterium]